MVDAPNRVTVDDIATEFQKHHHDSDLLRMLVADLRERRVDLNVFCRRVRMLIGAPVLLDTLKGLKVLQSIKKAQLQEREDQLASPVRAGNCRPPRAPAGELWSFQSTVAGPTPPFTASTTAAAASPAAASPAAAGGYADHAEVHSLKRKVEVLQQANQRLDAENAAIKQKLASKPMLLDSSAYATQRMLFERMLLKRVRILERYDRGSGLTYQRE